MSQETEIQNSMMGRALAFYNQGKKHKAINVIFEHIDDLLLEGEFEEVDRELRNLDLNGIPTTLIIGVLSITLAAHEKLPYREVFFKEVEKTLGNREEDRGRLGNLLRGLDQPLL